MSTIAPEKVGQLVEVIQRAAYETASKFFQEKLGGQDRYACGFAWVDIYGVRSNSKLGKALIAAGFQKSDTRKSLYLWNPSKFPCQNVDTLEAGAYEAAKLFTAAGFRAYAGSRLD